MNKDFCINLREIRVQKGLTQKSLAKLIKCSANKISKLERCLVHVNLNDLYNLSSILNVEIQDITGNSTIKDIYNIPYEYYENVLDKFGYIYLE